MDRSQSQSLRLKLPKVIAGDFDAGGCTCGGFQRPECFDILSGLKQCVLHGDDFASSSLL